MQKNRRERIPTSGFCMVVIRGIEWWCDINDISPRGWPFCGPCPPALISIHKLVRARQFNRERISIHTHCDMNIYLPFHCPSHAVDHLAIRIVVDAVARFSNLSGGRGNCGRPLLTWLIEGRLGGSFQDELTIWQFDRSLWWDRGRGGDGLWYPYQGELEPE